MDYMQIPHALRVTYFWKSSQSELQEAMMSPCYFC